MITKVIMFLMAGFMVWGVIDKIVFNNKFGYGDQFDEGMLAMGVMATSMVGFMCFAPVLGDVLLPLVGPAFEAVGADPSMLAGSILGIDMGGYPLAQSMASSPEIAVFAGGIYASMMGVCITFAIPVALGILQKDDYPYLARGIMCGIIAIPLACLLGGLMMGLDFIVVVKNLIPAGIVSILLIIGLLTIPTGMMNGFAVFSKIITFLVHVTLAIAIFTELTGIVIVEGMAPIGPQLEVVGIIGITLAGAYPLVKFITNTFQKPLQSLGGLLKVDENTISGIIACVANSLPMLGLVKDMTPKGKVMAIAFMVPAAFVFGDHLAYASANIPEYMVPLIVAKLVGGFIAIVVAMALSKNLDSKKEIGE